MFLAACIKGAPETFEDTNIDHWLSASHETNTLSAGPFELIDPTPLTGIKA